MDVHNLPEKLQANFVFIPAKNSRRVLKSGFSAAAFKSYSGNRTVRPNISSVTIRSENREMKLLLDSKGIEIPFSQVVVHQAED